MNQPVFNSAAISKVIAQERRRQRAERKAAFGTMNPHQMRQAINKGLIDPFDAVTWGTNEQGMQFTLQDIQQFGNAKKRVQRTFSPKQGATIVQLMSASLQGDIDRANSQIRTCNIHKINGGVIHLHVSPSGVTPSAPPFYGVKVRLDDWNDNLLSTHDYSDAVRQALRGRVSIDCTCGRYQYWFRYVATAAKVALAPYEKDFPKIRNPKLVGMCCKHQLKALKFLLSPTVARFLETKMAGQASSNGFLGEPKNQVITQAERKQLARARPRAIDRAMYEDQFKKAQAAAKKYKQKTSGSKQDRAYVKALEKEKAALIKKLKEAERKLTTQRQKAKSALKTKLTPKSNGNAGDDALKLSLKREIDTAKRYGGKRDEAIRFFAKSNEITLAKAKELAKGIK